MSDITPGPWAARIGAFAQVPEVVALDGHLVIARVYAGQANATAIAALPDLLAAADQALEHLIVMGPQGCLRCEGTIDMLKAATTKARATS